MYNFGHDRDRHRMDLEDLYAVCTRPSRSESASGGYPVGTAGRSVSARLVIGSEAGTSGAVPRPFHDGWKGPAPGGNLLDGYWSLFSGSEGYARTEKSYLDKARDIELSLAPAALPYYQVEEGRIGKDPDLILRGMPDLIPSGGVGCRRRVQESRAPPSAGETLGGVLRCLLRLWTLHPQAFLLDGIPIPLALTGTVPAE